MTGELLTVENVVIFVLWLCVVHTAADLLSWIGSGMQKYTPRLYNTIVEPYKWYMDWWRRRTPDWMYNVWLKDGTIDEETYREFQERGFIGNDLDPEEIKNDD